MLIKRAERIPSSEITDKKVYLNRRNFMRGAALLATAIGTGALYRNLNQPPQPTPRGEKLAGVQPPPSEARSTNEKLTSFEDITSYNNFYEFSTDKQAVAGKARGFVTKPWTVRVEGLVNKPRVYDLDELVRIAPLEERIYRLRCVEGWSMVIPWIGVPLASVLKRVEPQSSAKYVAFETLVRPDEMPGQRGLFQALPWPYVEGLRLDEAMHPLTILAVGLYGEPLPNQNGAPVRLVVPWKYGFKSIKSVVRISLVDKQPPTSWNLQNPREYGFYSNVNPQVDHPRWSQATERRIGESGLFAKRRPTLMFNGYADQVASLYTGLDLKANY
jgi:sulfoxide reductase catalytic subunit YedY